MKREAKLTPQQVAALRAYGQAGTYDSVECSPATRAALLRRGLVAKTPSRAGGEHITSEGRAWLAAHG